MTLLTILFIVFLILKLCNAIDWSWWAVTTPLMIQVAFAIISAYIETYKNNY